MVIVAAKRGPDARARLSSPGDDAVRHPGPAPHDADRLWRLRREARRRPAVGCARGPGRRTPHPMSSSRVSTRRMTPPRTGSATTSRSSGRSTSSRPWSTTPRTFGEIAAANAVSDVFAMGGRVLFALSIAAFPEELPRDIMAEVFGGASDTVRAAGGTLAGGHTIRDPEPKYGLAVIGAAHPDRLLRKGGARPGDALILTKRLGTGLLVSGSRQGRTDPADLAAAIEGMRTLNRAASEVLVANAIMAADRRDRFRPPRPWPRDGPRLRRTAGVRRRRPARLARCPRACSRWRRDRRCRAQPSFRRWRSWTSRHLCRPSS